MKKRPTLVSLTAVILFLIGIVSILRGFVVTGYSETALRLGSTTLSILTLMIGLVLVFCAVLSLASAVWTWYIVISASVIAMLGSVWFFPYGVVQIIMLIAVMNFLLLPQYKRYHGIKISSEH